ncbi:MAG: tryptophan 7-halogenase, partial [Chloroflexota bacterium]
GQRVLVFEANQHPRFAIGESMILETSEMMRAIADFYNIPEIAYFSSENYRSKIGQSHGVKRHFGFWHHTSQRWHKPERTLQAVIPKEPHGHELHLYRQDVDYFMLMCAIKYGATVLQNTKVANVEFSATGVEIIDEKGRLHTAEYVVDAGGFRSILANKFALRTHHQQTHSRGIFTHMIDVQPASEANGKTPFPMHEGTMHHVFDGGWLWVIPFNNFKGATNPVTSVGLMLDPRVFPQDNSLTAEEEFFQFIKRFPSIHAQLASATAIRDWVRAPRIQYGSSQVVGDRWALLGHAAGFIDPLYSKGLYATMASLFVLAHKLIEAKDRRGKLTAESIYSRKNFQSLETLTQNFLRRNDQLIAHSYKSWIDHRLWQCYSAVWLTGAYTEFVKLNTMRAAAGDRQTYVDQLLQLQMVGGGYREFYKLSDEIDDIMKTVDPYNRASVDGAVSEMKTLLNQPDWVPQVFKDLLEGKTYLPKKKIRPDIFKRNKGFLGTGSYREHFFGGIPIKQLLRYAFEEKVRHNPIVINR